MYIAIRRHYFSFLLLLVVVCHEVMKFELAADDPAT